MSNPPESWVDHWSALHKRGGFAAVGHPLLPETLNRWLYATWARRIGRFVREHHLEPTSVFDAGAGSGFWVRWWLSHGARVVDGIDFVSGAVDHLSARYPGHFVLGDLAQTPVEGAYDLVESMNVLLHITDASAFRRALTNLAVGVRPGGHLLLFEPLVLGRTMIS